MVLGSGIREKPIPDPGSRGQKGTGSRIWIRNTGYGIWIRILLSISKYSRKPLISTVLRLLFDFLSLKNDVKVPSESNMRENFFLLVFCWHLEGQ
jgi:hypothetical protein